MTRRRPGIHSPQNAPANAIDDAISAGDHATAAKVTDLLGVLATYPQDDLTGSVWLKPSTGIGGWGHCGDVSFPLDLDAIMAEMRERYGPGAYEIRFKAKNKIAANHLFNIAKERGDHRLGGAPAAPAPPSSNTEFFQMMMQQQSEARRDAAAAADRQVTMITGLATALAPLLLARQAPQSTTAADTIALVTALQDRKGGGGGLKETVETFAAIKSLMGPGDSEPRDAGADFDPGDLVASGARLIGPAAKAIGDYLNRSREPGAAGAAAAPGAAGVAADPAAAPLQLGAPAASRYRLVNLVAIDVAYGFQRGHDPDKIADLVFDVILANGATDPEIMELATVFALSPDGLESLAREGIDLRSNPAWADEFFAALTRYYHETSNDRDGPDGGEPDLAGDGALN